MGRKNVTLNIQKANVVSGPPRVPISLTVWVTLYLILEFTVQFELLTEEFELQLL